MKKLIASILVLGCAALASANDGIAHSSWTITSETNSLMRMDTSTNTIAHCLTAIVVSSASPNGILKVFNSTFSAAAMSTVTIVNLGAVGTYSYNDIQVKGIMYSITGNANGVSIIYKQ